MQLNAETTSEDGIARDEARINRVVLLFIDKAPYRHDHGGS